MQLPFTSGANLLHLQPQVTPWCGGQGLIYHNRISSVQLKVKGMAECPVHFLKLPLIMKFFSNGMVGYQFFNNGMLGYQCYTLTQTLFSRSVCSTIPQHVLAEICYHQIEIIHKD
jgi:hypothetical protein